MLFQKFHVGHLINLNQQTEHLGTQMKATGEVMSIGRNLEESLLKAIRSLEAWRLSPRVRPLKRA